MDLSKMQLLFKQDKFTRGIQAMAGLMMLLFGYCFYQMTVNTTEGLKKESQQPAYYITQGDLTIKYDQISNKNWILKPCKQPAGYCWVEIK